MSGGRTSQRSQSRNRKGAMEMTKWGTLTLDENPGMPPGVTGREDPISPKVPREILLRGNTNYIGRVKKAPGGQAQTTIELSYISSSHCCFFLRPRARGDGIEAAVLDTSSNGTSINGIKLGKKVTRPLKQGDEIALYLPQSASPLGRTIVYTLRMDESKMAQAMLEEPRAAQSTKKSKSANTAAAAVSVTGRALPATSRNTTSSNSNGVKNNAGSQSQNSQQSPSSATRGVPAKGRTSTVAVATTPAAAVSVVSAHGSRSSSRQTNSPYRAGAAVSGSGGAGKGRGGGMNGAVGTCIVGGVNGVKVEETIAPPSPAPGSERNVLEMLDDKVAVKKAAEESARRGWEGERQRFVQQTRSLRAKLDASAEKHQKLLSENSALREKLAEAESNERDKVERAAQEREWETRQKAAVAEAVAKIQEALQAAESDRQKAEATAKSEAAAAAVANRKNVEWKSQVDALTNQRAQQVQKLAEVAAKGKETERSLAEVREELAEASMNNSSLAAQLKEARASEQSLRKRVTDEEQAATIARQAKAEVEGRLAQRERELAAAEKARRELEASSEEVDRLSREIEDMQAAKSRNDEELEQTVAELAAERRLLAEEGSARAKLMSEVADLTATVAGLRTSLDDAGAKEEELREENLRLAAELTKSQAETRSTQSKLAVTQSELARVVQRKDGVKDEAYNMGINLEKAKKTVSEMSASITEHLAVLMGHLEIPGGYLQLDSQVDPSPGGLLDEDCALEDDDQKTESMGGSPIPSHSAGDLPDTDQQLVTTQVSPSNHNSRNIAAGKIRLFSGNGEESMVSGEGVAALEGDGTAIATATAASESPRVASHPPSEDDVMAAIRAEEVAKEHPDVSSRAVVSGWKGKGKAVDSSVSKDAMIAGAGDEEEVDGERCRGTGEKTEVGTPEDGDVGDDGVDADATDEEDDGGHGGVGVEKGAGVEEAKGEEEEEEEEEEHDPRESKSCGSSTSDVGSVIDASGDAGIATTGMRLEEYHGHGEQGEEGGHYDDDDTEFTVPPLDFGRGARPVERGEGDDEELGDEEDAGRGDPDIDSTQLLTSDEIRLGAAAKLDAVAAESCTAAAANDEPASRKRGRSEDGSSPNPNDKKAKVDLDTHDGRATNMHGDDSDGDNGNSVDGEEAAGPSEVAELMRDEDGNDGDPSKQINGAAANNLPDPPRAAGQDIVSRVPVEGGEGSEGSEGGEDKGIDGDALGASDRSGGSTGRERAGTDTGDDVADWGQEVDEGAAGAGSEGRVDSSRKLAEEGDTHRGDYVDEWGEEADEGAAGAGGEDRADSSRKLAGGRKAGCAHASEDDGMETMDMLPGKDRVEYDSDEEIDELA